MMFINKRKKIIVTVDTSSSFYNSEVKKICKKLEE